ncbi:MAG: hypothetical protein JXQ87_04875 [Bacteroidia bacterium]
MWDLWFIAHLILRLLYALSYAIGALAAILPFYTSPNRKFYTLFYQGSGELNFSVLLVYYPVLIAILWVLRYIIPNVMAYVKIKMDNSI